MIFSSLIISEKVSWLISIAISVRFLQGVADKFLLRHYRLSLSLRQASTAAKVMKSIASAVMLVLVAHCWLCVFTYYDDDKGKISEYRDTRTL